MKSELTGQGIQVESSISALPSAFSIVSGHPFESEVVKLIPPLNELKNMTLEVGLELENTLLGEDMRNNLAFSRMVGAATRAEYSRPDGDKGIIKVRF